MKTRIKIIEYNNGEKKFHCEYKSTDHGALLTVTIILSVCIALVSLFPDDSIIGIPVFIGLACIMILPKILNNWETMLERGQDLLDIAGGGESKKTYHAAVFDSQQQAQAFIEKYRQEKVDNKYNLHQQSIKKIYRVKHP